MRPVGTKSAESSLRMYARQISAASLLRAFRRGSMAAKCPRMLFASRRKKNSERLLCDAEIACGKSMIVGPRTLHSTL